MNDLVNAATNAAAIVLVAKTGAALVGYTTWRARPFPWASAALLAAVGVPSIAQLAWPSLAQALDRQPAAVMHHAQLWRLVTAALVQDGGLAATAFNLASLAVIASLAEWHWGPRRMPAIFLVAAMVFNAQGVAFGAGGAGSSGATFALGASLAGALILSGRGTRRVRAIACPLLGAAMLAVGNVHGIALVYGTVIGLALGACSARVGGGDRRADVRIPATVGRAGARIGEPTP
jgi:hypothetical protein